MGNEFYYLLLGAFPKKAKNYSSANSTDTQ